MTSKYERKYLTTTTTTIIITIFFFVLDINLLSSMCIIIKIHIGLSNPLGHPPNPPELDLPPPDLTSLVVRHGSKLSNPTPRGLIANFTFQNPWHPTRTETIILFGKILRILDQIRRDPSRSDDVLVFLNSDPAILSLPSLRSSVPQLRSGHSWSSFTHIRCYLLKFTQIRPRSNLLLHSNLLKFGSIGLDLT